MMKSTSLSDMPFPEGNFWSEARKPYRFGVLVFTPNDPIRSIVTEIRSIHDPDFAKLGPPAVLISQPFARAPSGEELAQLQQIIAGFKAFPLRAGPVVLSPNLRQVWLEITPQERLANLRERLHATGLFRSDLPPSNGSIFHLRLTEKKASSQELDHLIAQLNTRLKFFDLFCCDLKWIIPDEHFAFSIRANLFLNGSTKAFA